MKSAHTLCCSSCQPACDMAQSRLRGKAPPVPQPGREEALEVGQKENRGGAEIRRVVRVVSHMQRR